MSKILVTAAQQDVLAKIRGHGRLVYDRGFWTYPGVEWTTAGPTWSAPLATIRAMAARGWILKSGQGFKADWAVAQDAS